MSTATFPLLLLPENAQRKVLNGFDVIQLINFSLLSNNAKQLAKSLNLAIDKIFLCPDDDFIEILSILEYEISVRLIFYPPESSTGIQPVRGTVPIFVPSRVKVEKDLEETGEYQNPGLSVSEWLELFREVFNHPPILNIAWSKPDCLFNMKSIKDTVKGFNVDGLYFTLDCGMDCAQLVLKNFPEYKKLFIDSPAFRNPVEYQNILIQNADILTIGSFDLDLKISLDDILLINSEWIDIISRHITDKMINRYLKHWIQGSNPRMEKMRIKFEPNRILDEEVILKGLKYRRTQPNRKRYFRMIEHEGVVTAEEGIDIRRKDGAEGTIVFETLNGNSCFVFYVCN
ncbi:hypothetical protein GCK72_004581 [Caenorhabditis remanei]|uniref:F-box domain-containing protein n=1 Tax=Caenorhabditis remanei TaxID=31234 RepID=A0A6A5HE96_CAERE|nr:hypothetical protein GCK72_004581 [Caenorhabditis remanei]KAF1764632.1 hypothetical protein GCK72_004581 [Caenorhabditis remanei]